MITLENDRLTFRFPEVHPEARFSLSFQRTLRIPDDGGTYPLPPGLGDFPLRHAEDVAALPQPVRERGGVILPMYQAEALWLCFGVAGFLMDHGHAPRYPFAVKVATGKIDAVSGEGWRAGLHRDPQDYLVVPEQPWLDGYCVETGTVRQFVAAPLGHGATAEEQLTGKAEWGGIQIAAYPLKAKKYAKLVAEYEAKRKRPRRRASFFAGLCEDLRFQSLEQIDLGLAPGGRMRQHIYEDRRPLADWDLEHVSRCFVTLVNSQSWREITGEPMPTQPVSAQDYASAGLPWFAHYADAPALAGSDKLAGLKSVGESFATIDPDTAAAMTQPVAPGPVRRLGERTVREMNA